LSIAKQRAVGFIPAWSLAFLQNYMDDFVILAKTEKELHTIRFLKIAEKYNLCFKWSKCNFNAVMLLENFFVEK